MKRNRRKISSESDIFNRFPSETNSWLLSFSDIITMLLCFFMLFYAAEKKDSTNNFNEVVKFIQTELGLKGFSQNDMKDVKKMIENRFGSDRGFISDLETLNQKGVREVLNYSHYVSIEFPVGNLFDAGSIKPNQAGIETIMPVLKRLLPYQDKLVVNIVAYTDPARVKNRKDRWWKTNQELSALRALEIQRLFLAEGFKDNSVYISGRGVKEVSQTQEKPLDLNGRTVDVSQFNESRTVSIRLESRGQP